MQSEEGERGFRARADLVTAIILVAVGLFLFYESYSMPRLEARNIHPLTIPGLVPMALSLVLAVLGGLLGYRSLRLKAPGSWRDFLTIFGSMVAARVVAAGFLVLVFTLGLVGLVPFWAASMIFIFSLILTMETLLTDQPVPFARSAFWALMTAVVCGGAIYYLFAEIFLVRLP